MFLLSAFENSAARIHVCDSCDKTSRKCGYVERLSLATKAIANKHMASRQLAASDV